MKLIPQFSIRTLLGVTALAAVVFSVVGLAIRGHGWAVGVSAAVGAMVILLAVHALLFAVVWLVSVIRLPRARQGGRGSPFGAGSPFQETAAEAVVLDQPGSADATGEENPSAQ